MNLKKIEGDPGQWDVIDITPNINYKFKAWPDVTDTDSYVELTKQDMHKLIAICVYVKAQGWTAMEGDGEDDGVNGLGGVARS